MRLVDTAVTNLEAFLEGHPSRIPMDRHSCVLTLTRYLFLSLISLFRTAINIGVKTYDDRLVRKLVGTAAIWKRGELFKMKWKPKWAIVSLVEIVSVGFAVLVPIAGRAVSANEDRQLNMGRVQYHGVAFCHSQRCRTVC